MRDRGHRPYTVAMIIAQILSECRRSTAESYNAALASPGRTVTAELAFTTPWAREPGRRLDVTYHADAATDLVARVAHGDSRVSFKVLAPQRLEALTVAKPWGEELWLTGIEQRGECRICTDEGCLPLASYLATAPALMLGEHALPLLKILAPHAEPVLGDLYIEAHATKNELYVVSDIDPGAWPDGNALLLLGMNPKKRAVFASDDEFRSAYLQATQNYEATRRAIDAGATGLDEIEKAQRLAVRAFLDEHNVVLDSVVSVPPLLPHSLQHGVRVVECQTPVFERFILSFWQEVATQDHWDTAEATPLLSLESARPINSSRTDDGLSDIGQFDAFSLYRLESGAAMELAPASSCRLLMSMRGTSHVGGLDLAHEQAAFLPAAARCQVSAPANGYLLIVSAA